MKWNLDDELKKDRKDANEFLGLDGSPILDANAARHTAVALTDIARSLRDLVVTLNGRSIDLSDVEVSGKPISPDLVIAVEKEVRAALNDLDEATGDANARA